MNEISEDFDSSDCDTNKQSRGDISPISKNLLLTSDRGSHKIFQRNFNRMLTHITPKNKIDDSLKNFKTRIDSLKSFKIEEKVKTGKGNNLDLKIDESRRVSAVSTRKIEKANSVYVNKNLEIFEFALNFERMKIFKYYFPHNNSDTIIKKIVFNSPKSTPTKKKMFRRKRALDSPTCLKMAQNKSDFFPKALKIHPLDMEKLEVDN